MPCGCKLHLLSPLIQMVERGMDRQIHSLLFKKMEPRKTLLCQQGMATTLQAGQSLVVMEVCQPLEIYIQEAQIRSLSVAITMWMFTTMQKMVQ